MILCSNPKEQYFSYKHEIDAAIRSVLEGSRYVLGKQVESFEKEFASYLGVKEVVGVSSGTDAILLALKALDIGHGDEVITVSHTAVATVSAIELAGATPVLIDVEPEYFCMDIAGIESAITSRTRAIIPVHLYGQAADIKVIREIANRKGLHIVEDCAQAHGSTYNGIKLGSFGHFSCFSFYPTKNLGAIGDGGAIATNDLVLAEKLRLLRQYGWKEHYKSDFFGYNSRLDELQAAVLRVKLKHLDKDNQKRHVIADMYKDLLGDTHLQLPKSREGALHVFHQFVCRSQRRNLLLDFLAKEGVGALVHYPVPVHLQSAFLNKYGNSLRLPATEKLMNEVISLPVYPELAVDDVQKVAEIICRFEKS